MSLSRNDLAKIHIAKKELAMDDDVYRMVLLRVTGKDSASKLNPKQAADLLEEFKSLGWKPKRSNKAGRAKPRPARWRRDMMDKVEALLADAGRPWKYADATAKRMFGIERVEWLDDVQLHKLIAALVYDAKRREKRDGQTH